MATAGALKKRLERFVDEGWGYEVCDSEIVCECGEHIICDAEIETYDPPDTTSRQLLTDLSEHFDTLARIARNRGDDANAGRYQVVSDVLREESFFVTSV